MNSKTTLIAILLISVVGMLFSGYLSYGELSSGVCPAGGGCSALFGLPTCVYGLVMYTIIFILSALGLRSQ